MNTEVRSRSDLESELKGCGRMLMLSNRTMETYASKATPRQMEFLLEMMHYELDYREENKRIRLIKKAAFPAPKTFGGYEWDGIKIPAQLTHEDLMSCDFIRCSKNLVLYDP